MHVQEHCERRVAKLLAVVDGQIVTIFEGKVDDGH
jgi:hypothetical protein